MPVLPPSWHPVATTTLASSGAGEWLVSREVFKLVVLGSIVGLVVATLVILTIWFLEWRQGRVW